MSDGSPILTWRRAIDHAGCASCLCSQPE